MIAVQVELWPLGSRGRRKIVAAAVIENRGLDESGTGYRYIAELHNTADPELRIPAREQIVEISGHDRRQSVWKLLHHVLSAVMAEGSSQKSATTDIDVSDGGGTTATSYDAGTYELDLLAAAWGWRQEEVAAALRVDTDRLRAWRNRELSIDAAAMTRIALLRRVHTAMWQVLAPGSYAQWWRYSPAFGGRPPIQVALDDEDGFDKIVQACMSATR